MNEHEKRQLGPDVSDALRLARRLAGRELVIRRMPRLPGETRAMLLRPERAGDPYEIHYARRQERFLPHLIAHEVGHLVRLYQVDPPERLMPAITEASRLRAARALAPEIAPFLVRGLPEAAIPELFDGWLQGVLTQLANFPADLRIEAWIHDRFPGLRRVQERSLDLDVQRAYPLLAPLVAASTPSQIYLPTMAMNAAQAVHVAELSGNPTLLHPFQAAGFGPVGHALARVVFDAEDQGHRSDMTAVNTWADDLGLAGWFEWRSYTGSR